MNMATIIIAALGSIAFPNGESSLDHPAHVVAIQANSTEASGTLKLESVVEYPTWTDATTYETNVVDTWISSERRDAYVGTDLVYYDGSSATAWSNAWVAIGSATNRVGTLRDGNTTVGVWTNSATSIRKRDVYSLVPVTNVSATVTRTWSHIPFTNTLIDVALSGGRYSSVTNIYIPAGRVVGSGTALTNCAAILFTDR